MKIQSNLIYQFHTTYHLISVQLKAKDETEKNLIMSMYMDAMKEISNLEKFYYDMLDEDDE